MDRGIPLISEIKLPLHVKDVRLGRVHIFRIFPVNRDMSISSIKDEDPTATIATEVVAKNPAEAVNEIKSETLFVVSCNGSPTLTVYSPLKVSILNLLNLPLGSNLMLGDEADR